MLTVKATFRSSRTLHATAFAVSKLGVLRTSELAIRKIFVYIASIKIFGNTKLTVKTKTVYALFSVIDVCICERATMITATSHAVDINVLYIRVVNVGKWPRNHIATIDRNRCKIKDRGQGTKYIKKQIIL